MSDPKTDCRKCKAPMTQIAPNPGARGPFDTARMTITGYRCERCGHWNDIKRRKP